MDRDHVAKLCKDFMKPLPGPAFIILGWKNDDGSVDTVQVTKKMPLAEYIQSVTWAMDKEAKRHHRRS